MKARDEDLGVPDERVPAPDDAARIQAAFAELQAVLTQVTSDVTARLHERCPYRARDDRCTFAGGCRNQRRDAQAPDATDEQTGRRLLRCAGDHQLQRTTR